MSSESKKEQAIRLRKSGKSYGQIRRILGVSSKGTISYWLSGLPLSQKEESRLKSKVSKIQLRRLTKLNKERSLRIDKENKDFVLQGKEMFSNPSPKTHVLSYIGASLYWAEGAKTSTPGRSPSLIFTNSDPVMISLFKKFIRQVLRVEDVRVRSGIYIYPSIDEQSARLFWSKVTGLPQERFYIVNQVSRASKKVRGNLLPHGTLALKINNRREFYIMKGMVDWIKENI